MVDFVWASKDRKTVKTFKLAKTLSDGTVVLWEVEQTKVLHPQTQRLVIGSMGIVQVVSAIKAMSLGSSQQHTTYFTFSQFFYAPGDWAHTNGKTVDVFEQTYKKNLALLRKQGFKRVTDDAFRAMLPKSVR